MNFATMQLDNNQQAFYELVKAGLWEKEARLSQYDKIDYTEVYRLAEEQSVIGLVAAGIEHASENIIPQDVVLSVVGDTIELEQQNQALNGFVAKLMEKLRESDVYAILVKGQGIAQCYERPLWRTPGDVDLLLIDQDYEKAKKVLLPMAIDVETEYKSLKHLGITMKEGFVVELHGMLHSRLSNRIDRTIDGEQNDVFCGGHVRSWENNGTQVFLPAPDNDVIFVFTHILKHFYIEGIGLRQICDWCRLLWTYKDSLNNDLLESRIRKMRLMSEWKAFGAFAVDYLGMPVEAMPFYSTEKKWSRKAEKILAFVLEVGNFGHNRSQTVSENYVSRKTVSLWNKAKDFGRHVRIFPIDSIKFFWHFLWNGVELSIINNKT